MARSKFPIKIFSGTIKKIKFPRHLDTLWTFSARYSIKFSKNRVDSKIIKPDKCSLETCHAVCIEY